MDVSPKRARFLIPPKVGGQPLSFTFPKNDAWHHVVLIWDGRQQSVFLDGRQVALQVLKHRLGRPVADDHADRRADELHQRVICHLPSPVNEVRYLVLLELGLDQLMVCIQVATWR